MTACDPHFTLWGILKGTLTWRSQDSNVDIWSYQCQSSSYLYLYLFADLKVAINFESLIEITHVIIDERLHSTVPDPEPGNELCGCTTSLDNATPQPRAVSNTFAIEKSMWSHLKHLVTYTYMFNIVGKLLFCPQGKQTCEELLIVSHFGVECAMLRRQQFFCYHAHS